MSTDDRETLEVLKAELDFIEKGGYGRSVKTPQQPTSIFVDSLSCINYADPKRQHPCSECLLIDFVPQEAISQEIPCHHIPLSSSGVTVQTIEQTGNQEVLEETVKDWLRTKIQQLEAKSIEH